MDNPSKILERGIEFSLGKFDSFFLMDTKPLLNGERNLVILSKYLIVPFPIQIFYLISNKIQI